MSPIKGYRAGAPPRSLEEAYAQWSQIDPANIERADYWLHTSLLPCLLELCADAVQRQNLDALTLWLRDAPEIVRAYRRLSAPVAERVQRMLTIAADAIRTPQPPDAPDEADLHTYFRTGRWRPAQRAVRLTTALAEPDDPEQAVAITLLLEQVNTADAPPYAHPASHWLLFWDSAFQQSLDGVNLQGVRWSLPPLPPHAEIRGDSLGGALALGAQLLHQAPGDHRRFAVLARYDPDTQRLLPVEQFQEKYDAVCALRHTRAVLVSPAQLSAPLPRAATVETLPDALHLVQTRLRRQRLAKISLAAPIIPLLGLLWGLQQGSYTLSLTPSGRVMLSPGLISRAPIDTGYLASEILPNRLPMGRRWRWRMQPVEFDPAPYHEIAHALIDPFHAAQLYHALGDPHASLACVPPPNTPIIPYRFQRLEILYLLQPQRRAEWLYLARQTPAPDAYSRLAQLRALHTLGELPTTQLVQRLQPLALPPNDDLLRLEALALIAPHDPDWILRNPTLRSFLQTASVDRAKRGRALRVIALLSQQRLFETAPLIEPYRNDLMVQGSRDLIEILLHMLLSGDETYYFEQRERVNDLYVVERVEALALAHVFEGLLIRLARQRPHLQAQWEFLLRDLQTPFAARWGMHRQALMDALIHLTPPDQRPALRQYLQQQLQTPPPMHERLAIHYALQQLKMSQDALRRSNG